jgi:hypothetical protein
VLWIGSFVVMIATGIHALGGLPTTPPADLPPGVIGLVGWTNRLAVLSAWAWVVAVAWQVIKVHRRRVPPASAQVRGARGRISGWVSQAMSGHQQRNAGEVQLEPVALADGLAAGRIRHA